MSKPANGGFSIKEMLELARKATSQVQVKAAPFTPPLVTSSAVSKVAATESIKEKVEKKEKKKIKQTELHSIPTSIPSPNAPRERKKKPRKREKSGNASKTVNSAKVGSPEKSEKQKQKKVNKSDKTNTTEKTTKSDKPVKAKIADELPATPILEPPVSKKRPHSSLTNDVSVTPSRPLKKARKSISLQQKEATPVSVTQPPIAASSLPPTAQSTPSIMPNVSSNSSFPTSTVFTLDPALSELIQSTISQQLAAIVPNAIREITVSIEETHKQASLKKERRRSIPPVPDFKVSTPIRKKKRVMLWPSLGPSPEHSSSASKAMNAVSTQKRELFKQAEDILAKTFPQLGKSDFETWQKNSFFSTDALESVPEHGFYEDNLYPVDVTALYTSPYDPLFALRSLLFPPGWCSPEQNQRFFDALTDNKTPARLPQNVASVDEESMEVDEPEAVVEPGVEPVLEAITVRSSISPTPTPAPELESSVQPEAILNSITVRSSTSLTPTSDPVSIAQPIYSQPAIGLSQSTLVDDSIKEAFLHDIEMVDNNDETVEDKPEQSSSEEHEEPDTQIMEELPTNATVPSTPVSVLKSVISPPGSTQNPAKGYVSSTPFKEPFPRSTGTPMTKTPSNLSKGHLNSNYIPRPSTNSTVPSASAPQPAQNGPPSSESDVTSLRTKPFKMLEFDIPSASAPLPARIGASSSGDESSSSSSEDESSEENFGATQTHPRNKRLSMGALSKDGFGAPKRRVSLAPQKLSTVQQFAGAKEADEDNDLKRLLASNATNAAAILNAAMDEESQKRDGSDQSDISEVLSREPTPENTTRKRRVSGVQKVYDEDELDELTAREADIAPATQEELPSKSISEIGEAISDVDPDTTIFAASQLYSQGNLRSSQIARGEIGDGLGVEAPIPEDSQYAPVVKDKPLFFQDSQFQTQMPGLPFLTSEAEPLAPISESLNATQGDEQIDELEEPPSPVESISDSESDKPTESQTIRKSTRISQRAQPSQNSAPSSASKPSKPASKPKATAKTKSTLPAFKPLSVLLPSTSTPTTARVTRRASMAPSLSQMTQTPRLAVASRRKSTAAAALSTNHINMKGGDSDDSDSEQEGKRRTRSQKSLWGASKSPK